jgi:uncharacterized membrane protein
MHHSPRFQFIDALRGFALLWMAGFHFCFDLANAGLIQANFYADVVWTTQRTLILSLFLLCAGAGQAIAHNQGQSWSRFWRRWAQIAVCALLVSAGSALMFPKSYIYFGVLHGMAVMLVLVRLTADWGRWLWPLGAMAIAMKFIAADAISTGVLGDFLNERSWNWMGLISVKPVTEDYVPVFPWLGVMWWGMAAMQWWLKRQAKADSQVASTSPLARVVSPLAKLGRWSLSFYMLHQPVLLGGLWLWATFVRG